MTTAQPSDYGIDAPGVIRESFCRGVRVLMFAIFVPRVKLGPAHFHYAADGGGPPRRDSRRGILMLIYVKFGKFRHRDRMLSLVPWKGTGPFWMLALDVDCS